MAQSRKAQEVSGDDADLFEPNPIGRKRIRSVLTTHKTTTLMPCYLLGTAIFTV